LPLLDRHVALLLAKAVGVVLFFVAIISRSPRRATPREDEVSRLCEHLCEAIQCLCGYLPLLDRHVALLLVMTKSPVIARKRS
jgi:hypothetical protein